MRRRLVSRQHKAKQTATLTPWGAAPGVTSYVESTDVMGREGCRRLPRESQVRMISDVFVQSGASEKPMGPVENSANITCNVPHGPESSGYLLCGTHNLTCNSAPALEWSGGQPDGSQPPIVVLTLPLSDVHRVSLLGAPPAAHTSNELVPKIGMT